MGRVALGVLAALLVSLVNGPGSAAQDRPADRPVVLVAELDGIIHPISAEYLTGIIDQSDTSGADLVVFILRTPGGLLDSTQEIVSRMITSRAPVAVLVAADGRDDVAEGGSGYRGIRAFAGRGARA
jgi:membrane-bound serine protease (ClpP class)